MTAKGSATRNVPVTGRRHTDRQAEAAYFDGAHKTNSYVPDATIARKPSELLNTFSSTMTTQSFQSLVLDHLCPALDSLPPTQKSNIYRILSEAHTTFEDPEIIAEDIDYESRKKSFEGRMAYLLNVCKREWHDGWEVQSSLMEQIADDLREWLPVLWRVGVESHTQTTEVTRSLLLCQRTFRKVTTCNSRSEWTEEEPVIIHDSRGNQVYDQKHSSIGAGIVWVWRELMLVELASGNDVRSIIADVRRVSILDDVIKLLPANDDKDTETYHHGHWNGGMKAACANLRELIFGPQISEFETSPSLSVYQSLIRSSSILAPALLSTIRQRVSNKPSGRSISCKVAAEIFIESGQTEDLLKLLSELEGIHLRRLDEYRAYKVIARHFSTHKDEKLSAKCLEIVEQGIIDVIQTLMSELDRAFPGLDGAYKWLEEMVNEGKFIKKATAGRIDPNRDWILSRFVKMARGHGRDRRDWVMATSLNSVDKDDVNYEEEVAKRRPNFARCLRFWQDLLEQWGREETKRVREKVECQAYMFSVNDLAESLENECDDARDHLAAGIMVVKNFIEGGM